MVPLLGLLLALCFSTGTGLKCGERKVKNRVLLTNAYDTQLGDYPWHTAIQQLAPTEGYICGGTLISENAVLTSAHCVTAPGSTDARAVQDLEVQLGKYTMADVSDRVQKLALGKIIPHPHFNRETNGDDIAVLLTARKVLLGTYVQPACVPTRPMLRPNVLGVVVGWGYTENRQVANVLRAASAPVVSHLKCLESNVAAFAPAVNDRVFCAGWRNGTSPCNGDSGGGFFVNTDGSWTLVGIVSFTAADAKNENLCSTSDYTVFADVIKYRAWIWSTARRANSQHPGSCNPEPTTKRYIVQNSRNVTFLEAWRLCQNFGHRLATVTSEDDSRLLAASVAASNNPKGPWWIAGTDLGGEGAFTWISTNQLVGYQTGYTNYSPGQPDNAGANENCLEIGRWGGVVWNDVPCDWKQRYICEHVT